MFKYVAFGLLVASAIASPAPSTGLDCDHVEDALTCLAVKASATLERAARSADINLIDGVTLVRDTPVERTGKALKSESEIMSELPADSTQKAMAVATMMYDNAAKLVESHSLKVDMSEGRTIDDNIFSLASTKKYKKMLSPLMTLIGVKLFALAPVFLGGLALFVTKAIFLSKVAILIAGVLLYQKFFGAASHIAGGFPNDFFAKNNLAQQQYNYEPAAAYAQNLAYSAQAPTQ